MVVVVEEGREIVVKVVPKVGTDREAADEEGVKDGFLEWVRDVARVRVDSLAYVVNKHLIKTHFLIRLH